MLKPVAVWWLFALGTINTFAADIQHGKTLHNEHCTACHGTEVYTRADHRIQSKEQLLGQVERCTNAVGVNWEQDKIEDVAAYLDHEFYQFGQE